MVVTCTPSKDNIDAVVPKVVPREQGKSKGHAVCSDCGGEVDIWLDM